MSCYGMGVGFGPAMQPVSATEGALFEAPKRSYGAGVARPWAARGNIGPLLLMEPYVPVPHSAGWGEAAAPAGTMAMRPSRKAARDGAGGSARRAQSARAQSASSTARSAAAPGSRGDGVDLYAEWTKACRKDGVRAVDTRRSHAAQQRRKRAAGHAQRTAGAARMLREAQCALLEQAQGRALRMRGPAAVPGRAGARPASAPALAPGGTLAALAAASGGSAKHADPSAAACTNWGIPDEAEKWARGGGAPPCSARSAASARGEAAACHPGGTGRSSGRSGGSSRSGCSGGSSRSSGTVWSAAPSVTSSLAAFIQRPPKRLPFDGAGSATSAEMPPEFCKPHVPFWETRLEGDSAAPSSQRQRTRGGPGRQQLRRRLDHNQMLERGGAMDPALFSKARRRHGAKV
jgi:hypothetical protein